MGKLSVVEIRLARTNSQLREQLLRFIRILPLLAAAIQTRIII